MAFYRSVVFVLVSSLTAPAFAQDAQPINPVDTNRLRALARAGGDNSAVSSSISVTMPVGATGDVTAAREAGLKAFYEIAARSCDLVIETIAETCELTRVNSTVNSRDRPGQVPEVTVSGQINMSVKFKGQVSKTP